MNVLMICEDYSITHMPYYALVPSELLQEYDIDSINGQTDDYKNGVIGDQISMIFDRLGLIPFISCNDVDQYTKENDRVGREKFEHPPFTSNQDLKKYLDFDFPITIDKIITIRSEA